MSETPSPGLLRRSLRKPSDGVLLIETHTAPRNAGVRDCIVEHGNRHVGALSPMQREEGLEVETYQVVPVYDQERRREKVQDLSHSTCGAKNVRLLRVMHPHAPGAAVPQYGLYEIPTVMKVHPDVAHTGRGEPTDVTHQDWLTLDGQERLGNAFPN